MNSIGQEDIDELVEKGVTIDEQKLKEIEKFNRETVDEYSNDHFTDEYCKDLALLFLVEFSEWSLGEKGDFAIDIDKHCGSGSSKRLKSRLSEYASSIGLMEKLDNPS